MAKNEEKSFMDVKDETNNFDKKISNLEREWQFFLI